MAVIDVVKWNAPDNVYAWKFPSESLATWTQLIVSESQEAFLLLGGKMHGPYGPGRHTLSTANIPILIEILKIPFGGRSPFSAEVWFVNKTMPLDVKWGTSDPIQIMDPQFNVMVPVRAFGQLGLRIEDSRRFLMKLTGTMPSFCREDMVSYFKGVILTKAKSAIAGIIIKSKTPVLHISSLLDEISIQLKEDIAKEIEDFGVKLVNFYVNSINVPEDDPAVMKLKDALAKKAEMNIVGFSYQQERSFDVLQGAAENQGSAQSGLMGAGIGLGMGLGVGGQIGNMMSGIASNIQPNKTIVCPACNTQNAEGNKFCASCGNEIKRNSGVAENTSLKCGKCGAGVSSSQKFCPECGESLSKICECGANLSSNIKFCPDCGKKQ